MFNTFVTREAPRYPQTIHEHRAPTDESVRILMELEKAAERRVIERGKTDSADLDVRWSLLANPHGDSLADLHMLLTLNGKEHRWSETLCLSRWTDPRERGKLILDSVSKFIANHVLCELFSSKNRIIFETLCEPHKHGY